MSYVAENHSDCRSRREIELLARGLFLCSLLVLACSCGDASRDAGQQNPDTSGAADQKPTAASEEPAIISGTVRQNNILRLAVTEARFDTGAPDAPPGLRYYTIGLRGMSRVRDDVAIDVQRFVFAQNERGCISQPVSQASWLTRPFGDVAVFSAADFSNGQLAFLVPDNTQQVRVLIAPSDGNSLTVPTGTDFTPGWPTPINTIEDGSTLRVHILPDAERSAALPAPGREHTVLEFVIENLLSTQGIEFTTSQQLRLVDPAGAFVQPSALTQQLGCRLDDGDPIPAGQVRRFLVVYELPTDAPLRLQYRGFEIDEAYVDLKSAPAAADMDPP